MFIDFKEVEELPEGLTPEMLASDAVQNHIKKHHDTAFEARFDIEASGLKKTISEIKDEKQKLQGYLDEYKDIDMDEYKRLQEFKKNNGDATKQIEVLTAERDSLRAGYEEKLEAAKGETQAALTSLYAEELTNSISQGIREHNAKFPTVALIEASDRWVNEEAKKVWKRDDNGEYLPMDGDRVMTGANGVLSYAEWVNSLRSRVEFAPLFKTPEGAGAPGGKGGSGTKVFNPKDFAGSTEERQAAIKAKFDLPA